MCFCRDFRLSNQSVRLILRTRLGAIIFFGASVIIFYYVRLGSCATWISSALGYLPMHIVMTAIVMVMLYWFMPKDPDEQDQVLQVRQLISRLAHAHAEEGAIAVHWCMPLHWLVWCSNKSLLFNCDL